MHLLHLFIENFGVFKGKHHFNLAPELEYNRKRHLTIVSGHNGAGKSTIFQSIMLALYGSKYAGNPVSSKEYQDFLLGRMHRSYDGQPAHDETCISLCFRYVRSGRHFDIRVERRWRKQGRGIQESLQVWQDDQLPEVDPLDYQAWLEDFVPWGIEKLCFFDAEQLDSLARQDQKNVFGQMLFRLLGLDVVQRLEKDLEYLLRQEGSTQKIEQLYKSVLEVQLERDGLDDQLTQLKVELENIEVNSAAWIEELANQERLLAAEGGSYAARRPVLQERLKSIDKEVEILSSQLRDLTSDLLPFTLAPALCLQLFQRLKSENQARNQQVIGKLLQERSSQLEQWMLSGDAWDDQKIPLEQRRLFTEKLVKKLAAFEFFPQNTPEVVHHLSEPEQRKVLQWISSVLRDVPQEVQTLGKKLHAIKKEQRKVTADLQKAPNEAALAPIHAEITRLQGVLLDSQRRRDSLNAKIGSLQFQREEKQRWLQENLDQYNKAKQNEKKLRYTQSSQIILRTYKDALVRQRVEELEHTLLSCFNKLCRKELLLAEVQIDPESFDVQLKSIDGTHIKLSEFSAGERQLYAMALLWALRIVSKFPLPLVIDTPLARLDEVHRLRVVQDYLPHVSDQVLLLTTDAEIDLKLASQVKPQLAHFYRMVHDLKQGQTRVTNVPLSVAFQDRYAADVSSDTSIREKVDVYGF